MQQNTAARHQFSYADSDSTAEAQRPDTTTPQLIALAVSLVGDQSKVMEQMRCSEADFSLYCSGEKELPLSELHRLVSLIMDEQRIAIAKHREALSAFRAKRFKLSPG